MIINEQNHIILRKNYKLSIRYRWSVYFSFKELFNVYTAPERYNILKTLNLK